MVVQREGERGSAATFIAGVKGTKVTTTETGYIPVPNGKLYYEIAGAGEPLVFVHGFTLDTRMWDDQWEVFAETYLVVRYDVRGFGRSDVPSSSYANYVDLDAVVQHLELERPHVVGLSMGGGIAIDYAVNFPEGLRSMTMIDSSLGGYAFPESFRASVSFGPIAKEQGLKAAIDAWLAHPFFVPAAERPAVLARLNEIVGAYHGYAWRDPPFASRPSAPSAAERLGEVRVPTLVIVGERDIPEFRDVAKLMADNIAGAKLVIVRGAGHMSNMESPAFVNEAILSFLQGV
jgi:pimeloyl-ACP methyl ester carboxylesterase